MAQNVMLYQLFISCPSDIKDEITLIDNAVEEFNEYYARPLGISIKTCHWRKSSYPQSGGKPQKLLNEQLVDNCDAAVAIFWTRFGSPTEEYASGTEEEIERMLQSGKQVFMYFSDKAIPPSQMDEDGYKQVLAFREKYKDRGIYYTYSSDDEFKKLFFAHLSKHFSTLKRIEEVYSDRLSNLKLLGIDKAGKLSDEASVYPFVLNTNLSKSRFVDTIRSLYNEIAQIDIRKLTTANKTLMMHQPVVLEEHQISLISCFAEALEVDLPEGFFDLGNLCQDLLCFGGIKVEGTPEEEQKYWKIEELYKTITEAMLWAPVEAAYSGKNCIKLALQNCGKAIDEDVEIAIELPQSALLILNEFPSFKNEEKRYLVRECDIRVLFGIESTAEYIEYSESENNRRPAPIPSTGEMLGCEPNYREEYSAIMNSVFCYSVYPSGDKCIVKLKVDYIKHNTVVAFPSVLFIKDELSEIPYRITSKNNPDIVEGVLKVHS
ncbi:MAG: hypothetical protein IJJ99_09160 [Oscillospiraceae bacterium]|nr:hypothetical protein [Oscillospiraceae bacterium]